MMSFSPRQKQSLIAGVGTAPNLLVIGAQKAGTTWLHHCLAAHPDVFMSNPKELWFFDHQQPDDDKALADYLGYFANASGFRFRGESTPGYFWTSQERANIPKKIRMTLDGDTRFVVSLRDPSERAISAFFHHFRLGRLDPRKPLLDQGSEWGVLDIGHYKRHAEEWFSVFDQKSILHNFL